MFGPCFTTKLIGGGESDTIMFTINEKGTYDYVCSFPGHSALMKGKLIIE
ncbi:plastocyanin/azurin family copper-binding protein [Pedobacter sp. L105]|nr:plastocyanin/azurin family copper-binding protein [Pedobacter sp. L105]